MSQSREQVDDKPCIHFAVRPVLDRDGLGCQQLRLDFGENEVAIFLVPDDQIDRLVKALHHCRNLGVDGSDIKQSPKSLPAPKPETKTELPNPESMFQAKRTLPISVSHPSR